LLATDLRPGRFLATAGRLIAMGASVTDISEAMPDFGMLGQH